MRNLSREEELLFKNKEEKVVNIKKRKQQADKKK